MIRKSRAETGRADRAGRAGGGTGQDGDTASGPGAREWRILAVVLVGSPAISATIQRQFSGDVRSRAFGYLGGTAGQPEPGRRSLRGIEVSWK